MQLLWRMQGLIWKEGVDLVYQLEGEGIDMWCYVCWFWQFVGYVSFFLLDEVFESVFVVGIIILYFLIMYFFRKLFMV